MHREKHHNGPDVGDRKTDGWTERQSLPIAATVLEGQLDLPAIAMEGPPGSMGGPLALSCCMEGGWQVCQGSPGYRGQSSAGDGCAVATVRPAGDGDDRH
ncbi:hypothetical protein SKAU_G00090730 [Synaphobranchus kaupii]|uniref:Uncharacterized protein n=1 Tax=Synaphobranchus kaupii TaxID=118154 RepID=A0A9Q1J4A2_SYNKA|nr:hypothetical protein SKAU_G00090730 [Synaphobranchus kaupii]